MRIRIITDTGSDLPTEFLEKYPIDMIPMTIHFGEEAFEDKVNLSNKEFFEKIKSFDGFPKTAAPSPTMFLDKIESAKEQEILIITISSQLSSTYQNAVVAKSMTDKKVTVIDSKNGSIGVSLVVILAARMAEAGMSMEGIEKKIEEYIETQYTIFVVENLEYLVKGGRVNKYAGMLASALNIKLISIKSPEGTIEVVEKCRGSQKAFKRTVEMIQENAQDLSDKLVGITHVNCLDRALQMKELLETKCNAKEILISEMGATIGSHTGEGAVLISF